MGLSAWTGTVAVCVATGIVAGQPGPVVVWGESDPLFQAPPGNFWDVSGGGTYAVGIREDRTLTTWGAFVDPLLAAVPSGTFRSVEGGTLYCVGIRMDGTLAAWGVPEWGLTTPPSGIFTKVSASEHHAAALRADGTIAVWGAFHVPTPAGQFIDIAVGKEDFCLGLRADGTLVGWGANNLGQINVPSGQFVSVVAGDHWGGALRADGTVALWGGGGGNPALLNGVVREITADYFTLSGLREDGTVVSGSAFPAPPSGVYGSVASGNSFQFAIVPAPPTLVLLGCIGYRAVRGRRCSSTR